METTIRAKLEKTLLIGALACALCMPLAACAQAGSASTAAETPSANAGSASATIETPSADAESTSAAIEAPSANAEIADVTSVAYLGPAGTYTEEATRVFFGDNDELLPKDTVADALALVADGTVAYAVVPQENTLGGPVTDYIDALIGADGMAVVGEVVLPIRQTLMGLPGTDLSQVKTVCSHKQGLAQSSAWLKENLPGAELVEKASTAAAAQEVAEGGDATKVAIAAPGAADLYGLEVLQQNVSQSEANATRFYVVSRTPNSLDGYDHIALVADITASELPSLLDEICEDGAELVCVHDRPDGSALGAYRYVIELQNDSGFTNDEIEGFKGTQHVTFLGAYRSIEG